MFSDLFARYEWNEIQGCPGRYILGKGIVRDSISELAGKDLAIHEEQFPGAQDPVSYCFFTGGGIISYQKKDGYLHTLCDEEGMNRKLDALKR